MNNTSNGFLITYIMRHTWHEKRPWMIAHDVEMTNLEDMKVSMTTPFNSHT